MVYGSIKCNKTEWPVGADLMDDLKSRGPMECRGFEFLAVCATTTGALLALALMMPAKATEVQPDTGAVEDRGGLHVERRTQTKISGAYGYAGSLVAYKSERIVSEQVVKSDVVVNGKVLQVRKNLTNRAITFDGHDNTLSAVELETLVAMIMKMDRTDIAVSGGPPQEDLLYRLIEYVSTAPVGSVLGRYAVPKGPFEEAAGSRQSEQQQTVEFKPVSSSVMPKPVETEFLGLASPSGTPMSPEECNEAQAVAPWDVTTVFVACQRRDDDGVAYLDCKDKRRGASYDGKNNCFRKFSYGTSACRGRCGPRCGLRARGKYTQDCLDHDACCGRYGGCINGAFGSCADEFREADDDVFRARRNCRNR